MHSLTICFGPTGTIWNLMFKSEEGLKAAEEKAMQDPTRETYFVMTDDYGQNVSIKREQIIATLLQDMDQSALVQIEVGVHNLRTQARTQQRAATEPALKAAMMAQGPAVLSGGVPRYS